MLLLFGYLATVLSYCHSNDTVYFKNITKDKCSATIMRSLQKAANVFSLKIYKENLVICWLSVLLVKEIRVQRYVTAN